MTGGEPQYEILRQIGEGGTAEVFEASRGSLKVAIKRFSAEISSEEFLSHFLEEAAAQFRFHHPGIPRLLDYGISEGRAFLVMERIEGRDLPTLETDLGRVGATFPFEVALTVIARAAEALDAAHHALDEDGRPRPILHGDLSPENVMLADDGSVKVIDFGFAPGRGKRDYAPPEGQVSPAGDVYALGATLRWMLGPEAPVEVQAALDRAMDPDPKLRPSAGGLSAELLALLPGRPGSLERWLRTAPPRTGSAPAPPAAANLFAIPQLMTGSLAQKGPQRRTKVGPSLDPPTPALPTPTPAVPAPTTLIGANLHGLIILDALAHRPWASVYRARHQLFDRRYAVKVLHAELARHPEALERFKREALMVSRLDHPNIVKATDFGLTPRGEPFIAMELVEGRSLQEVVVRDGPLAPDRARRLVLEAAIALQVAHQAGLIHRDLKPSNLMLTAQGTTERLVLIDFGVAGAPSGDVRDRLTATGQLLGTPAYMAPEQVVGLKQLTSAADLYGLGATIHFLLTGAPPFGTQPLQAMQGHLHQPPPPLPEALGLGPLAMRLMSKDPQARGTLPEVIALLRAEPKAPPRSKAAWAALPLALGLAAIGGWWLGQGSSSPEGTPAAVPDLPPTAAEVQAPAAPSSEVVVTPRAAPSAAPVVRVLAPSPRDRPRRSSAGGEGPVASDPEVPAASAEGPPPATPEAPDLEELRARLARVKRQLEVATPELQIALDQRYLDLRSALTPTLSEEERRRLGSAIEGLSKELARSPSSGSPR